MLKVSQIKIGIDNDCEDTIINKIASKLKIKNSDILKYEIIKKSIDARDKTNILYVYEVLVNALNEDKILRNNKSNDIIKSPNLEYKVPLMGSNKLNDRIIIVGSGPAGLFASYMLSSYGYKVTILERGEKVEDRAKTVEEFFKTNKLNINSNIQFGEGGAGTFSDGKLNTLTKDKFNRSRKVFSIFVENGAPEEILYLNKPHIGTDILREVIKNMRNKIIASGGEILYNSCVTDIDISNNKVKGVIINNSDYLSCSLCVLAIGHSARDTFYMLKDKGLKMKSKNFAVGVRIEHPQEMINKARYGNSSNKLGPADYKLTYQSSNGRGVYSFCMCPGGFVVNASSEDKRLVVNGMSNYKRDEKNANSAVVVTVTSKDFDDDIMGGVEFQRKLEEKAYELGKGYIPVQLFGDYLNNRISTKLGDITPNTKGKYSFSNLNSIFPEAINEALKEGILHFDKIIKGYARSDSILLGVESRTSSPIVMERNDELVSNIECLYPIGEGAGYAGGITTSAIDGIKVFESIMSKYSN